MDIISKKKEIMKIIKRILVILLLLVGVAFAFIYFYKDRFIKEFVKNYNKNLNVVIAYSDVDLTLFKRFPNANLTINNLSIVNKEPLENDTIFYAKNIYLAMNVEELFKKQNEKIAIKDIIIDNGKLNLLVDENGLTNYDIRNMNQDLSKKAAEESTEKNNFTFDVEKYELVNTDILYANKQSEILVDLRKVNHTGKGDFSASKMDLITETTSESFTIKAGNVAYLNKTKIDLDAVLAIDFDKLKFTLKENKAKLNDLDLVFNGFVAINENNQEFDISFHSPKANFKSVLSLVPSAYSSSFSGVAASGIADVKGKVSGFNSETEFPKYNIHIKTNNASFKYPDLPKAVKDISFDGAIINVTTKNDVFLDVKNLKFTIDKDTFEIKGKITNLTNNPTVDAAFKGTLNLENLTKAYPIKLEEKLTGILKADFTTLADKKSIEQNKFEKIKANGTASLEQFSYNGKDVANPIHIKNASIKFNTTSILLTAFKAKTGGSDISATGQIDNMFAFIFDDKNLKGNFKVVSNNFIVSDFLVEEKKAETKDETSKTEEIEALKIPKFLDVKTQMTAKKVVYDDLVLENVSGTMRLKDQIATLTNTKANMLGGKIAFNGNIDTKKTPSYFDLDLAIKEFDIANSFNTLETFQKLVPIAKTLKGKYNTSFKIKGNLNNDFSPNISSLSGDAIAQLLVNNLNNTSLPLLNELTTSLKFIDLKDLDLTKLKTALTFKDGNVVVAPFDLKYKDMVLHVSGSHGFDKSLKYKLLIDVPAKYLGTEAVNLLSKLTNINKDTIKIPLSTMISGSVLKPQVQVNFKQALTQLAVKVVKYQKQELQNQVTNQVNDVVNDAIGDILSNNGLDSILPTSSDTTKQNPVDILNGGVKEGINDAINGIFGGKKKKKKKEENQMKFD